MGLKRNQIPYQIVFWVSTIFILALSLWKIRQGIGLKDEHFYAALGYRLWQGDGLIADEWWMAQLMGFFVWPVVGVWRELVGSNDGIVWFYRLVYTFCTILTGIHCFYRLKKWGKVESACLASLLFMLFVPYNIPTLSYNTMGLLFMMNALLCFEEKSKGRLFLSGFLYGCAVINSPFLALGYFILLVVVAIKHFMSWKDFGVFTLGIVLIALIFLGFLFSRASISSLLIGLQHVFDPSHSEGLLMRIIKNVGRFVLAYQIFAVLFIGELIVCLLLKNKKENHEKFLLGSLVIHGLSLIWIIFLHPYSWEIGGHSLVLFPIAWFGLLLLILKPSSWHVRFLFWVSVFYAAILLISSNVGPVSYCNPLIIASMMTIILIGDHYEGTWLSYLPYAFVCLLCVIRIFGYYGEPYRKEALVTKGPCKGLWDRNEVVKNYESIYEDMQYLNSLPGEYAMFITNHTWEQVESNKKLGNDATYNYFWFKEDYIHYQEEYFHYHPDKTPLYIYLDEENPYDMKEDDPWLSQFKRIEKLNHGILFEKD